MAHIIDLPIEIISSILSNLDSVKFLYAAVSTCRYFRLVYDGRPSLGLEVLNKTFHPCLVGIAVALLEASRLPMSSPIHMATDLLYDRPGRCGHGSIMERPATHLEEWWLGILEPSRQNQDCMDNLLGGDGISIHSSYGTKGMKGALCIAWWFTLHKSKSCRQTALSDIRINIDGKCIVTSREGGRTVNTWCLRRLITLGGLVDVIGRHEVGVGSFPLFRPSTVLNA